MRETKENGQVLYSVSEAVRETGVPSHVLRYWEDELGIAIRRTSQGHRIYSEEDLAAFRKVKELKEKGIQLKAIRLLFDRSGENVQLSELLGQSLYERQEQTGVKPEMTDAGQEQTGVKPEMTDAGQEQSGAKPEMTDTRQEETAAKHETAGTKRETAAANRELHGWQEGIEPAGEVEYEILPKSEAGTYQLFETMLRSLISEEIAGQNEKLEEDLADLIRNEIEELYIQLRRDTGEKEAAAAQIQRHGSPLTERGREGLLRRIKKIFLTVQ